MRGTYESPALELHHGLPLLQHQLLHSEHREQLHLLLELLHLLWPSVPTHGSAEERWVAEVWTIPVPMASSEAAPHLPAST